MELEQVPLQEFAALFALIQLLRTRLQMNVHVPLLDPRPAIVRTLRLEIINQLLQTHIGLEPKRQRLLAARALPLPQTLEALLANDVPALHAIERDLRQLEADDALQLIEGQRLVQVVHRAGSAGSGSTHHRLDRLLSELHHVGPARHLQVQFEAVLVYVRVAAALRDRRDVAELQAVVHGAMGMHHSVHSGWLGDQGGSS